jgi:hypothetical protein
MLTARLLAAMWLWLLGVVWLVLSYIFFATMSGITTLIYPLWLSLIILYGGPLALVLGSVLVLTRRFTRSGAIVASAACAWLTWWVAQDLWPSTPENNAIAPMQYDWLYFAQVFFVVSADAAIIVMWRTLQHLTNR